MTTRIGRHAVSPELRLLGLGALVALLVSCQGGVPPAEAPAPAAVNPLRVTISGFTFNPPTLVVPVGTTVTWVNLDAVPHTATSTIQADRFDSGKIPYGATFSHTFTSAGRVQYLCVPHPGMQGAVEVQ